VAAVTGQTARSGNDTAINLGLALIATLGVVAGLLRAAGSIAACGSDTTRQMANQAFFTRIYLDTDDQITAEPTPSYSTQRSRSRRSPGPASIRTGRGAPLEPSRSMTRVRVRRIRWS
jgi:hypothetical protein